MITILVTDTETCEEILEVSKKTWKEAKAFLKMNFACGSDNAANYEEIDKTTYHNEFFNKKQAFQVILDFSKKDADFVTEFKKG